MRDLQIEPDLRGLRETAHGLWEVGRELQRRVLAEAEDAREDDGHGLDGRPVLAGELPEHSDAGDAAMIHVPPHPVLDSPCGVGEGRAIPGPALDQEEGGEVSDDIVDIGMALIPVEECEVDGRRVLSAPLRENVRVGGEKRCGGGQALRSRAVVEALPFPGRNDAVIAMESGSRHGRGIGDEGESGRRRHVLNALPPVRQRRPLLLGIGGRLGDAVAEGHP